jgi:SAM-dependent methyltransferase
MRPLDARLPCRACDRRTQAFLAFGELPLANALVPHDSAEATQERFPLTLTACTQCHLVQLAESVAPVKLFRHYLYMSSTSSAFLDHAARLAHRLIAERALGPHSLVIDIASNDGYLLQYYRAASVRVLGVEPAVNVAAVARSRGIETVCDFFSAALSAELHEKGIRADVVHAHNVLAHVPDLNGFVAGIAKVLAPGGVAVIEVPYLRDLIDHLAFDTVYHEHLCYFALTPLASLFMRHGLRIARVERVPVHGGSIRLFAEHATLCGHDAAIDRLLDEERAWGVADLGTYRRFAEAVAAYRGSLREFLGALRAAGRSIAGYGAAAKGAMLLNYCGIGRETVDFVVDRNPAKQNLDLPGVRIPVFAPDELVARRPDLVLLLTWNFADEIMAQQQEYLCGGGRFILPVPTPRIIGAIEGRRRDESS